MLKCYFCCKHRTLRSCWSRAENGLCNTRNEPKHVQGGQRLLLWQWKLQLLLSCGYFFFGGGGGRGKRKLPWLFACFKIEKIAHVWYIKILTRLQGFSDKIANFSRLHCLAISRRDLSTKRPKPNIKKWRCRKHRSHVRMLIYRTWEDKNKSQVKTVGNCKKKTIMAF